MGRFIYWQSETNRQWYWHLKDGNNRIIADSAEGYMTKDGVLRAIDNVRREVK